MLRNLKLVLSVPVLLVASGLAAQEVHHSPIPGVFVRLSYDRSGFVEGDDLRHMCVAIFDDGSYRAERLLLRTERREGRLTEVQFERLKKLLAADRFEGLPRNDGALIRENSERFALEIPAVLPMHYDGKEWHYDGKDILSDSDGRRLQWLNADGESPFPLPLQKIVDWLKGFGPKDWKEFEYAEFSGICPSGGLRLVQPTVAANGHP